MPRDRKATTSLVQDAIAKGVSTVEEVHKSLASLPFEVLEESKLLRRPAKEVNRLQDQTIGAIYGLIRRINQRVGALASELFDGLDKRRRTRAEADGC